MAISPFRTLHRHGATLAFAASVLLLVFVGGMLVGDFRLFPYDKLRDAKAAAMDLYRNWRHYAQIRPDLFLFPAKYHAEEFIHDADRAWPGVTLITGFLTDSIGLKLVDMDGRVIHTWRTVFPDIFPDATHTAEPVGPWNGEINGARLYPNGDIVFNMYRKGFVKMDRCGAVLWKAPYRTHHALYQDQDGFFWVPGEVAGQETFSNQMGQTFTLKDPEYIFKFSSDGKLLQEWDLVDIFYRSGHKGPLFADIVLYYEFARSQSKTGDFMTHQNDIEMLEGDLAPAFPMFALGDLLISMRHLNRIAVLDGRTMTIKWDTGAPFLLPHDPDFMADGRISVFDNFGGGGKQDLGRASRILAIDPATGATETLYQADPPEDFFTDTRGMHQHLPNGNMLITESNRGRVFEVTPAGDIVWQYVNAWDDERVIATYQSERYPLSYAGFTEQPCD